MDIFKIIISERGQPLATIAELPADTTLEEAKVIFRKHFLPMADDDDDVIVELFREPKEALN